MHEDSLTSVLSKKLTLKNHKESAISKLLKECPFLFTKCCLADSHDKRTYYSLKQFGNGGVN